MIRDGQILPGVAKRTRAPRWTVDENSLWTLTEEYHCNANELITLQPKVDVNNHETFTDLICKRVEGALLPAGLASWNATYQGVITSGAGSGTLPEPVESIQGFTGNESIQVHPKFELLKQYAATFSGVVEDDQGLFVGFKNPTVAEASPASRALAGVTAFLNPGLIFRRVRYRRTSPNGSEALGFIDNPGGARANALVTSPQNWLMIQYDATEYGGIWQILEAWLRSGPLGWNPDIYTP